VPVTNTMVSYQNLIKPFGSPEALLAKTSQAAAQVYSNPADASAAMTRFAAGLDMLRVAQGNYPQVMHTPHDQMGALLQTHVADNAVRSNKLESILLKIEDAIVEFFDVKFSPADWLGWMLSFFTWIEGIVPATRPPASDVPQPVPNSLNFGILGDWGTGHYGAPVCATSIKNDPAGYDILLHLGDVYYSGLPSEIQNYFEFFWPGAPLAFSLNGNHEMYTGGHGYFEVLLPYLKQPTSYFALQNDFWTFIGLDSAYCQAPGGQEGVIDADQVPWVGNLLKASGKRNVVLFSHHQPFSTLDNNNGGNLLAQLGEFLEDGKTFVWYWGHEHRCILYDPHPKYGFRGRCVGHGGFPQPRQDLSGLKPSPEFGDQWRQLAPTQPADQARQPAPSGWVLDSPNVYIPVDVAAQFSPHGFMRLEFRDDKITEYVRAPDNSNLYIGQLP
jgi:hypothetical protein